MEINIDQIDLHTWFVQFKSDSGMLSLFFLGVWAATQMHVFEELTHTFLVLGPHAYRLK